MVIGYLVLIEFGERHFYRIARVTVTTDRRPYSRTRHLARRAARFTTAQAPTRAVKPGAGGPPRPA